MKNLPATEVMHDIQQDSDEMDIRDYLYVLSSYKWSIIGLTLIITLIAAFYANTLVPVYRATATLLIQYEKENIVSIEQVYNIQNAYFEYYQTQLEILRSRDLAERLVNKLKLDEIKDFNKPLEVPTFSFDIKRLIPAAWGPDSPQPVTATQTNSALQRQALISQVAGMLDVSLVPESQLVKISYDAYRPELTALLANGLAEIYIESGLEANLESTRKASVWITEQLKELKNKLDESEKALQEFLDREQLLDAKGVDSLAVRELDDISTKLIEAKRTRSEVEELYRQITALEGQPVEAYESIPAVLKAPQVNEAKTIQADAERKVAELAKRYGPKHPKMIAANSELDSANEKVKVQIKNIIDSVKKEYSIARADESHLAGALNSTKKDIDAINRKSYELKTLEHDVQTNRQLHDMFLTRFKETAATSDLKTPSARIVDTALPPVSPYKPDRKKIILRALLLGLLASLFLVFLIEKLDNTLAESADVENKLFLPVLSILPKLRIWGSKDSKKMRYFTDKKHSGFSENIRTMRTSVLLSDIDVPDKVILVTSSVSGEGKSIVSVNLALALGQMGKTLLIDADMRKPYIARIFSLGTNHPGLSHFISGANTLEQCVHYFEGEQLHVMPAGQIPSNPLELLSSHRFENGLDNLRKIFKYIVIDSAPTVPVSDPIVLSRLVNCTIYLVKANDTPYQMARIGIKKLQQVNANILGVVLNQVTPAKRPGRYGYGESDYYTYYGYHKK
jgi:capsular exopolysaccharide synthesis family protein